MKDEDQPPQASGRGEHVGVCQRALGKPDGIDGGEERGACRNCWAAVEHDSETVDREQGDGRDQAHGGPGDRGREPGLPPQCEVKRRQRRMTVGQSTRRNHIAGAKEIIGRRDVVTRLVPVVGQAQQGEVREVDTNKEQREDQPQGERAVQGYLLFGEYSHRRSSHGSSERDLEV